MTSLGHTTVITDDMVIVMVTSHKTHGRIISYNILNIC